MNAIVGEVSVEMLPCPFCGSADLHAENDSSGYGGWVILCDNPSCEATGPMGGGEQGSLTPDDAARKWNQRFNPKAERA